MPTKRPEPAEFGQGSTPTIACVNAAITPIGAEFRSLVAALQKFVDLHFAPVWNKPAHVVAIEGSDPSKAPDDAWLLLFTDMADVADALGYHDLTPAGQPCSHVFVKTTLDDGGNVCVTASHELAEMLVDPGIQLWADDAKGQKWAYEVADAVEETSFRIDGFVMTNFVYPAAFEGFRKPKSARFDHLGLTSRPFQLLKGGYSIVEKNGKQKQIFGSKAKERRHRRQDRRLHRGHVRLNNR